MNSFKAGWLRLWNTLSDRKCYRYYGAIVVFAGIVFLLFNATDGTLADADPLAGAYSDYLEAEKKNPELVSLIENYYAAYAKGDTETLLTLADPVSEAEQSFIQFFSERIDSYDNIEIYYKRGLDDSSYLVSVVYDMKIKDIDTPAPGLDFFYVQTNDDGKLYINNRYGSYNQANAEYDTDPEIEKLIGTFESQSDMAQLYSETQTRYADALENDEALYDFVNVTLPKQAEEWRADYQKSVAELEEAVAKLAKAQEKKAAKEAKEAEKAAKKAEKAAKKAEEEKADEASEGDASDAEDAENVETTTVYATAVVNVRKKASEDANVLGQVLAGQELPKYADKGDWSQIEFEGKKAFVKTEYLTTQDDAIAPGTDVTMSATVNIRAAMNESANKVGSAYAGSTVTVEKSFACGWSLVDYGGGHGFIRSDYLQ